MHKQFSGPAGAAIVKEVRDAFLEKNIFFSLHRHISFVCGGNEPDHFRTRFLTYLESSGSSIKTFKAEDAVKNLLANNAPAFVNLAQFEDLIAAVVDSILIFPESYGSIAELGYFARSSLLRKKILVANDISKQDDSFINLGPIAHVNSDSIFRPTLHLGKENPDFPAVIKKLLRYDRERKHRDRFHFNIYERLSTREKMAAILHLIRIFRAIDIDGLNLCVESIFQGSSEKDSIRFLSILETAGFIDRIGKNHENFAVRSSESVLLDIDRLDIDTLAARATYYFKEHDSNTFAIASGSY